MIKTKENNDNDRVNDNTENNDNDVFNVDVENGYNKYGIIMIKILLLLLITILANGSYEFR